MADACGFPGMGNDCYPLPRNMLDQTPHFSAGHEPEFNETCGEEIQNCYQPLG